MKILPTKLASDADSLLELLEQRDQQLAALHASSSWRVTAPLRWLGSAIKRLRRSSRRASKTTKLDTLTSLAPLPSLAQPVDIQPSITAVFERLSILSKGQIRIAYFAENVHSSTFRYRAANMAEVLNAPAPKATLQTSAACFFSGDLLHNAAIADGADVLVIIRARYDTALAELVHQFKAQGKQVWFDLDDWVVDTQAIDLIIQTLGQDASDEVLNYWYSVVGRMAQALRLCDGAITTNDYLADKLRLFLAAPARDNVKVIPNFINQAQLEVSEQLYQRKLEAGFLPAETIKLGYFSGSATHNLDFALLAAALVAVMTADTRVQLVLVGPLDVEKALGAEFAAQFASRITQHGLTDYLSLQHLIAEVDYNLVPLQNNAFTNCKSELKFFDAAAVGTLSIASPTYTYAKAIRHGQNGYLAADDAWEVVLKQAIQSRVQPAHYAAMAQSAHQTVLNRFVWQQQRSTVLQALRCEP